VRCNIEGIDAVLRATNLGFSVTPVNDAHKAEREAIINGIKAAAETSKVVKTLLDQFGKDLADVRALNKWGIAAFAEWDKLDATGRKSLVEHGNWKRLQAHRPFLQELFEGSAGAPPIQKVMVPWKHERLPYTVIQGGGKAAPAAPAKKGTDELGIGGKGKASTLRLG